MIQNLEIAVVMDLDLAEKGTANDEENSTVDDISYQQVKTRYSYGIASDNYRMNYCVLIIANAILPLKFHT